MRAQQESADRREREQAEHREQVQRLLELVAAPREDRPTPKPEHRPKIPSYTDGEDVETFLEQFEGNMRLLKIPVAQWMQHLVPVCAGKAREALRGINYETAVYDEVKRSILHYFDISTSSQRESYKRHSWTKETAPREFIQRKRVLLKRWLRPEDGVEQLLEKILLDGLLEALPGAARRWVRERDPKTVDEMSRAMQLFVECAPRDQPRRFPERRPTESGNHPRRSGNTVRSPPGAQPSSAESTSRSPTREGDKKPVVCYKCRKPGHFARDCTEKVFCNEESERREARLKCTGAVEGGREVEMWLDTGCSRTTIRSDLVPKEAWKRSCTQAEMASGELVEYPLADVELTVRGKSYRLEAAVSHNLPVPVLLGRDVAVEEMVACQLPEDVWERCCQERRRRARDCNYAVVTRSQHRAALAEQRQDEAQERLEQTVARPLSLVEGDTEDDDASEMPQESEDESEGESGTALEPTAEETPGVSELEVELEPDFPFAEELFGESRPARAELTRTQRKANAQRWASDERQRSSTFQQDQAMDGELQDWRSSEVPERVIVRDGLLFRRWTPKNDVDNPVDQLVLPKKYRGKVLQMAHDVPLAGHLGREKTANRILQRFYWPTVFADVRKHCQSCAECQQASQRGRSRAPMIPLPIIHEPFQRIAMDVVGPLPKTGQGHRYILVVCDYSTRYPEAFPLKRFTATAVAEQLVELFSRHGIPREILTDQGSNFTSALLQELYTRLGVKALRTTPYHPQTDGLVERFNQTLKQMLRKFVDDEGKNWNKLLPYVLFAYREVPQASTGFSPFELTYGREVRGPLDVIKDGWTMDSNEGDDIVTYVNRIYHRLQGARDVVQQSMQKEQERQRKWYNQKAREQTLEKGDQVLLLLPTRTEKLLAKWRGPYTILEKIGRVNYLIEMPDTPRGRKLVHVNLLKKWYPRGSVMFLAEPDEDVETESEQDWRTSNSTAEPKMGPCLTESQRRQMREVLGRHSKLVNDRPGRIATVEHTIPLTQDRPVRQRPFRLPAAYRDEVAKELEEMRRHGVIEPTTSPWASPMVVVPKKDGTARICIDYRRLNSVTAMDAYPLPRIEEILDSVGAAAYISTLDLSKGYWQIPVKPEDRDKTAFISPMGLFRFTTMPFGLCGAPATFQRAMDELLRGRGDFTRAYLDDIVIYSTTWDDHLKHLDTVFQLLEDAGLTIKIRKCQLGMRECSYLGHRIGGGVVRPENDKIEVIRNYPRPVNKKEVRIFLGLAGYYRRFIPRYAEDAKPLTDLTKKLLPERVRWTEDCERAFRTLQDALTRAPVLRNPDFERPFTLQTDASNIAVGAVLSQTDAVGEEHPVCFWSKKLLPREQRYATVERECLAVKLSIEKFSSYLLGRHFVIQTDHRALRWLNTMKETNSRLTRWSLSLQPYRFDVVHRAGRQHANADAMSRMDGPPCSAQEKEGEIVTDWRSLSVQEVGGHLPTPLQEGRSDLSRQGQIPPPLLSPLCLDNAGPTDWPIRSIPPVGVSATNRTSIKGPTFNN